MKILKQYNAVMNTKQSHFLDNDNDNKYKIQGPKNTID
jgi:hypothetical protein